MKVLIANRGEIAVRVIRACRELGYPTVAVHSTADRRGLHVLFADEAVEIGPAPSRESYLVIEKILDAAKRTGAEAVHPGYGFLAENADFAEACRSEGLIFIGPSPEAIRAMGSKTESRQRMRAAGVPIVPGLEHPVQSVDELLALADTAGYPLMIKASAGGGGKGMRRVDTREELIAGYERVSSEALSFFGDGAVYAEKLIERPRHIEVQVLGDQQGNLIHLLERECTLQRRHQKVVEECPSPVVDEALRERLGDTAVRAAKAVGYYSAGTVELLMGPDREFYFLEMNTRLQVEHPVTEMVTGIDLVKAQIRVAEGKPLGISQRDVKINGHAIEARIYAEDPFNNFAPSPGRVRYLSLPEGPGIRNENGVYTGYEVPIHYDPMLSKLVAHGANREEATARLLRALSEYRVEGIQTTIPFYSALLSHPDFAAANFDTGTIARFLSEIDLATSHESDRVEAAMVATAIAMFEQAERVRIPIGGDSPWKMSGRRTAMRRSSE